MANVKNDRPVIGRKRKVEDDHVQDVSKETLQCFLLSATGFVKKNSIFFVTRHVTLRNVWKWTNCA
jgi:hypothetical protein